MINVDDVFIIYAMYVKSRMYGKQDEYVYDVWCNCIVFFCEWS